MIDIWDIFGIGENAVLNYASIHVVASLIPAFFLAGAASTLISRKSVMRYLGVDAPRRISYSVAAVGGSLLAVCSFTVLPVFGGILRRGAGLGPASTFLFAAPAINILAIILTKENISTDIAIARFISALFISLVIGLTMAAAFHARVSIPSVSAFKAQRPHFDSTVAFIRTSPSFMIFLLLVLMVFVGGFINDITIMVISMVVLSIVVAFIAFTRLPKDELNAWGGETWFLVKHILPLLVIGIFVGAIVINAIPPEIIASFFGNSSLTASGLASLSGTLFYLGTLTEVPLVSMLMDSGMAQGPALTMLLVGPTISLPSLLVFGRIMGFSKALIYVSLVIVMAFVSGFIFGNFW
jgi:uncharacterized membrane protein YraQ (UPF0718 family)